MLRSRILRRIQSAARRRSLFNDSKQLNRQNAVLVGSSLMAGILIGRATVTSNTNTKEAAIPGQHLPDGFPRTCCEKDQDLTDAQKALPKELQKIVGQENVILGHTESPQTAQFLKGARLGHGPALCIVTPRKLHDVIPVVQTVLDAGATILPQGQNTGLTGGSVPRNKVNDRPTVVLSMKHLDAIIPIDDGKRMICFAGAGLASLQSFLDRYFDRESHSTLGSTFLNPTTSAGVAFGSGGTQCRKGPAYTERALYLKISTNKWNECIIDTVNTLDVDGLEDRKELLKRNYRDPMDSVPYRLDTFGRYITERGDRDMYYTSKGCQRVASDASYVQRLCELSSSVNRANADTHGPDCCRSEGKVILLATVHDTFPKANSTRTFWISFDSLDTAQRFREKVALDNPRDVPISMEYLDRDAFDVIDKSGRVMANCIHLIGMTSPWLRLMWNAKIYIEASHPGIVDRLLHRLNDFMPSVFPEQVQQMAAKYDHHVAVTVGDYGNQEIDSFLIRLKKFIETNRNSTGGSESSSSEVYEVRSPSEANGLSAARFVAAPAFRTWCVANDVSGFSVDYALPGNSKSLPTLPKTALKRMRYSHFACNVVHEDIALPVGEDTDEMKHALKASVEKECDGKLPAEHGHGTEYAAPNATQSRWMQMDPLNVLNPGIGGMASGLRYKDN